MDPQYPELVSGPTLVCSSGATFEVDYLPSGCSVEDWDCSNNLYLYSAWDTYAIFKANGTGDAWIRAEISNPSCSSFNTSDLDVWAGAPPTFDISGTASIVLNSTEHYIADVTYGELATYGVNYYDWTVTSKLQFESSHAYQIDVYVKGITLGFGTISFYTTNSCGTSTFNFPVRVVSSKSLNIYPNPASSEITIEIEDDSKVDDTSDDVAVKEQMTEEEYMVTIYDNLGILVYSNRYSNISEIKINTSGWQEGIYYVTLINGDEKYTGSFIIE